MKIYTVWEGIFGDFGALKFLSFLYAQGNSIAGCLSKIKGMKCKRTSEESGTMGGRKEKEFVDNDLTMEKHLTI